MAEVETKETEQPKVAKPISRVADIRLIADPPRWATWLARTPEETERALISWAKEFEQDFLRDHRSQDAVTLRVERVMEEVCSACGNPWEEDEGACAWCGLSMKGGE